MDLLLNFRTCGWHYGGEGEGRLLPIGKGPVTDERPRPREDAEMQFLADVFSPRASYTSIRFHKCASMEGRLPGVENMLFAQQTTL